MSIVINANNKEAVLGHRVSNAMIGQYPDFNQILMHPDCRNWAPWVLWQNTIDYRVNWTTVNILCDRFMERKYTFSRADYTYWSDGLWSIWDVIQINQGTTKKITTPIVRIGILAELEGGELIGERILWLGSVMFSCWNSYHRIEDGVVAFTPWLLHRDGSISNIWTYKSSVISGNNNTRIDNFLIEGKSNGLIAQKGDIIVCSISAEFTVNAVQYNADGKYAITLNFGKEWGFTTFTVDNYSNYHMAPIQISIT